MEAAALFTALASIVTGILIARTLGPGGRGQVVVVATWGQALAWLSGLSIDKALMARSGTEGRRATQMRAGSGVSLLLSIGLVASLSTALVSSFVAPGTGLGLALAVVVFGTVAVDARAAHLLVHDRWREYALLRFAQPATYLVGCLAAAALAVGGSHAGAELVVLALCLSLWLPATLVGGLPRLRYQIPTRAEIAGAASFAGGYHVGSVMSYLTSRIDLIAVSFLFNLSDVGVYAVAASVGQLVAVFGAANLVRGLTGRIGAKRVDRGGLVGALILSVTAGLSAPWLLTLVYGEAFAEAGILAMWLCAGGFLFFLRQGFNGQLAGAGRTWATAGANTLGVVAFLASVPFADSLMEIAMYITGATAFSTIASAWLLHRSPPASPDGAPETQGAASGQPVSAAVPA